MGLSDQGAEQAMTGRGIPERSPRFGRDADGDELLDPLAVGREDAKRPVPRIGELGRHLHDAKKDHVERELRSEDHAGFDESPIPVPH